MINLTNMELYSIFWDFFANLASTFLHADLNDSEKHHPKDPIQLSGAMIPARTAFAQ